MRPRCIDARLFAKLPNRYAFVREPRSRIESAFRMYYRPHNLHEVGFSRWVIETCAGDLSDMHITPQSDLLDEADVTLIKWNFSELSRMLGVPPIVRIHASDPGIPTVWTDQARDAFRLRYWEDFELWECG